MNDGGSIDLYLSPEPVKGFEAKEKKWILGDPELVK